MSSVIRGEPPPRRTAPFEQEPGFYDDAGLWLYGNTRLLDARLACVPLAFGPNQHSCGMLDTIEQQVEDIVLSGKVLVCGIHNDAHKRAAIVPLRWGSPRIVVVSGGFFYHIGEKLDQELFRAARLWRYGWDASTDLIISRRAPAKLPTYASHNSTVDDLIQRIADQRVPGLLFQQRSTLIA